MNHFKNSCSWCDGNDRSSVIAINRFYLEDVAKRRTADKIGIEFKFPPEISGLTLCLFFCAASSFDFHANAIEIDTTIIVVCDMTVKYKYILSQVCVKSLCNMRTK